MSGRKFSAYNERRPDLSMVDRRLSALSMEEKATDIPAECDLSEVSTIVFAQNDDHMPGELDTSGWSTPQNNTPSSPSPQPDKLVQYDSPIIQFKKETKTSWSKYPKKGYKTTTKYFYEEIDSHWTAALIIVCFFASGIVDSVTFQTYSVFTSLQTGNTVVMALRLSSQSASRNPFAYLKAIVSIVSYCLGALFFNILHRAPTDLSNAGPRLHRWTLFTSFIVQSVLSIVSAALAQSGWVSTRPFVSGTFSSGSARMPAGENNYNDLIPIALLAFEAAGQVCLSRVLIVNELPTIVISTLYHDFIADALSWRQLWRARKSNWDFIKGQKRQIRRIMCIIALFTGAIVGGFVYNSPGGIAAALWIAAGVKVIVSVAWCLWRKKVVTETVVVVTKEQAPARPA